MTRAQTIWSLMGLLLTISLPDSMPAQTVWQTTGDPTVEIGDVDEAGTVVLERPIGATRFQDGTIAVADAGSGTVLIFDGRGRLTQKVGGPGEGPGEFRVMWWMGRCDADSVLVWDIALRRMTVIGSTGTIGRQYPFPESPRAPAPFELACSRQGRVAYQAIPRHQERIGVHDVVRGTAPVFIVDRNDGDRTTVADVASPEMVEFSGAGALRPLGKRTSLAVWRDRVFVATADSAWVQSYQPERGIVMDVPVAVSSRAATRDDQTAAVARMLRRYPSEGARAAKEALEAVPTPAELPPYNDILVDDGGLLWAILPTWGENVTILRSVGPDPEATIELRVPVEVSVFEIGRDYVIGLTRGPLDLPRVAMFEFERAGFGNP